MAWKAGGVTMGASGARRGGGAWRRVREQAWRRDCSAMAPCHICGRPVDYGARPSTTDDSWEPDHVIPVAAHPELELDLGNIKASHKRCNAAKKAKACVNELGNRSREW